MSRQMKDSGIPWIGTIPSSWCSDTIGRMYLMRNEKVSDKDFPPLSVGKMGVVPQLESAAKTDDGDNRKLVKIGDFAINSRSDRRGSCGISAYDGSVSLINTIITPREEMNPQYYNWLFHTEAFADEFYKWGHGIVDDLWTTRWQEMKKIDIIKPSLSEQKVIADFLDRKCSQIDELISLQEKMIEELKTYKQAVITETVTKGLNPDAPMKDSGVEWIGKIPKYWTVQRLKSLAFIVRGGSPRPIDEYISDVGYNWIKIGDTIKGNKYITSVSQKIIEAGLSKTRQVYAGDLILTNSMSFGEPYILKVDGCIHDGWVAFSSLINIDKEFLYYYFFSTLCKLQFQLQVAGGVVQNLNVDKIASTLIVLPPMKEQNEIVLYLDKKCLEIDNLISLKLSKIEKLKEYKKSLIYEYVTGKKEIEV